MSDYILSCCSTADMTEEFFQNRDISYVCFHYFVDGQEYLDDIGKSMPFDEFYKKMQNGADTKTSQVNVGEYEDYFRSFLEQGKDILHVTLSSGISGAWNSAVAAKEELEEEFPDRKIYILDSKAASSGYGLLMDKLADKRDEGMDIDELYQWADSHTLNVQHWFFTTDLTFLIKGGRISKVSGWFGTALDICPLLNVNNEGKLIPRLKVRGKKKVIKETIKKMEELAYGNLEYSEKCFISNSGCYEDARKVADMIEEKFPNLKEKVVINSIGTTIGSHTGPGTVAVFFWGYKRKD